MKKLIAIPRIEVEAVQIIYSELNVTNLKRIARFIRTTESNIDKYNGDEVKEIHIRDLNGNLVVVENEDYIVKFEDKEFSIYSDTEFINQFNVRD